LNSILKKDIKIKIQKSCSEECPNLGISNGSTLGPILYGRSVPLNLPEKNKEHRGKGQNCVCFTQTLELLKAITRDIGEEEFGKFGGIK
jgi:hypothetical protein